jgi:acyl-CoA thioester hydrolase
MTDWKKHGLAANKSIAQPWECDVMGHMTTRFYISKFDDASYHVLHEVFGWTISAHEARKYGWADVRHVIEYKAEVSAGDVLEIRARVQKIGGKSFTTLYEMINLSRDELAATLESVCVHFDLDARQAIPISEEMKDGAAPFMERFGQPDQE